MKHTRLFAAAGAVLALDRLTKLLWRDARQTLIPGVLALRGARNTGMAFGLLAGRPWLLIPLAAAVVIGLLIYLRRHALNRLCQYCAGLLLGGALCNLLDRVFLGYVIDFIDPVFLHWFIFNLADAGICLGAGLLMIHLIFGKEEKRK